MSKPNDQSTSEKMVDQSGSTVIERVKYDPLAIKPPAPTFFPENATNDALGAQSKTMRNDADHQALQNAGLVWLRHQSEEAKRWQDWTEILCPALIRVQEEAMQFASTDKPRGRRYAKAVSELLETYKLDQIDCATRSNAIKILQNLDAVTAWRNKQKNPEALNHPSTVWRKFVKERQSSPKPSRRRRATLEDKPLDEKRDLKNGPADPGDSKENDDLLGLPLTLFRLW